jgi:hypothetical protein
MRRCGAALVCLAAATCLAADPSREVLQLFTEMAASLSAGNAREFLAAFDPAMPGYGKLRQNVTALVAQGDIESSVEIAADEGDAQKRALELDWRMRVKREQAATAGIPRQQRLKVRVEKRGKKWKVTWLEPLEFFAP